MMKSIRFSIPLVSILTLFSVACGDDEVSNTVPTINDQSFTIEENSPSGTVVGELVGMDVDEDPGLSFRITGGNSDSIFLVDNNLLLIDNPRDLDFESNETIALTIRVQDKFLARAEAQAIVTVTDVNEQHTVEDQILYLEENPQMGAVIGKIEVLDPEGGTFQYAISDAGSSEGVFDINENGELLVLDPCEIDFEQRSRHTIKVEVTDGLFTDDGEVVISVANQALISGSGLIAFYPFDGGADDESTNAHNGLVSGAVLAEDRHGCANSAYFFDGQDDYISIGSAETIDLSTYPSFTLSVWVKSETDTLTVGQSIFSKYSSLTNERIFNLLMVPPHHISFGYWEDGTSATGVTVIDTVGTDWANIVIVKTEQDLALYLDGVEAQRTASERSMRSGSFIQTMIGATFFSSQTFDRNFHGSIDDLRIYNRALSEEEILTIYEKAE